MVRFSKKVGYPTFHSLLIKLLFKNSKMALLSVDSMVVIWSGIALRVFPPKVFECWAGLAARQHKLRRKKKENALTGI